MTMYLLLIANTSIQYKSAFICLLLAFLHVSSLSESMQEIITLSMEKHRIVPDVFDKVPKNIAKVSYGESAKVDIGNILTPTQTKDPPVVSWEAEPNTFYTLAMIDPDAPSRKDPKFKEWIHWLVTNIAQNDISEGEAIVEYVGAAPPKDMGLHRYVIAVFKQPGKIEFGEKKISRRTGEGRKCFSLRNFAKKYKLSEPVAANMFQAQHDEYCSVIYRQLSSK